MEERNFQDDVDDVTPESERELKSALARIQQGKTPAAMHNPYTGEPMNRAQRRQMKAKVTKRLKKKEKEK